MRKIYSLIALFAWVLMNHVSADQPPVLTAELPEGTVTVMFPASSFEVGDQKPFKVMVTPAAGKDAPKTVRGRFGMPYMAHWVTDEQSQAFSDAGMEFMNNIPMMGVYRFRVWLDYADGRETKTAVDFKVMANKGLDAEVVEE